MTGSPAEAEVWSPGWLRAALATHGYLATERLAAVCALAVRLRRPLFVEGGPGVGKTSLGVALARAVGRPLVTLRCHQGMDVAQALYAWDVAGQLLHLRAAEALAGSRQSDLADHLHSRAFLRPGPLLQALEMAPCVLLVDDVDRGDEHLEAYLLEFLADFTVTVPELGAFTTATPPWVVVTSGRTREVHDALKRRCHFHQIERPEWSRQVAIIRMHQPGAVERLQRRTAPAAAAAWPVGADVVDWVGAAGRLPADDEQADAAVEALGMSLRGADEHG